MSFEEVVGQYALPILSIAVIAMILVGIIKIFTKVLPSKKHEETQNVTKVMSYLYVLITMVFIFGLACGYHWIFNLGFDWKVIGYETLSAIGCSQVLYPIYRDYGGRFLLRKLVSLFKGKDAKTDEIITIVEKVLVLTDKQKEDVKNELTKDL